MTLEKHINIEDAKKIIPHGPYCYFGSRNPAAENYKPCPFWELREYDSRYGYCSYLDRGDDSEHASLCLWDQVKECGVNGDY